MLKTRIQFQPILYLARDPQKVSVVRPPLWQPAGLPLRNLDVRDAGIDILEASYHAGTACSETHLIYMPLEGSIGCDYGQGVLPLVPGEMLIAPAGGPHWVVLEGGSCRALWFHLGDQDQWHRLKKHGPGIEPVHELPALHYSMERCIAESTSRAYGAEQNTVLFAGLVANYLLRELVGFEGPVEREIRFKLQLLTEHLNSALGEAWTVKRMADFVTMSPGHLHRMTAKHLGGSTPMGLLKQLRLQRAEELLLHTNMTLSAIAEEVGYQTPYSFSNAFTAHTGLRPGAFRASSARTRPDDESDNADPPGEGGVFPG